MPNIWRVVMKKILAICLGAAIAITATGCGDKVTLTEEQNDLIAEYVAGVMLKHSYDNEWNYQKLDIAKNTYNSKGSINNSAATNNTVGSTQASTVLSQPAAQSQTTQQTAGLHTRQHFRMHALYWKQRKVRKQSIRHLLL